MTGLRTLACRVLKKPVRVALLDRSGTGTTLWLCGGATEEGGAGSGSRVDDDAALFSTPDSLWLGMSGESHLHSFEVGISEGEAVKKGKERSPSMGAAASKHLRAHWGTHQIREQSSQNVRWRRPSAIFPSRLRLDPGWDNRGSQIGGRCSRWEHPAGLGSCSVRRLGCSVPATRSDHRKLTA